MKKKYIQVRVAQTAPNSAYSPGAASGSHGSQWSSDIRSWVGTVVVDGNIIALVANSNGNIYRFGIEEIKVEMLDVE
jgi:hypothetical protein